LNDYSTIIINAERLIVNHKYFFGQAVFEKSFSVYFQEFFVMQENAYDAYRKKSARKRRSNGTENHPQRGQKLSSAAQSGFCPRRPRKPIYFFKMPNPPFICTVLRLGLV
jgi:hypothetical protein